MGRPQTCIITEEIKAELANPSIRLYEISKRYGISKKTLTKWSYRFGFHRQKDWTAEEENYLRAHIHAQKITKIAKDLHRSVQAVKCKCIRMHLSWAPRNDGYTLSEVAIGLGRSKNTVIEWIDRGWLRGKRRGPNDIAWNFSDGVLRSFLRAHPEVIQWNRISEDSKLWVKDILAEKGLGELA